MGFLHEYGHNFQEKGPFNTTALKQPANVPPYFRKIRHHRYLTGS